MSKTAEIIEIYEATVTCYGGGGLTYTGIYFATPGEAVNYGFENKDLWGTPGWREWAALKWDNGTMSLIKCLGKVTFGTGSAEKIIWGFDAVLPRKYHGSIVTPNVLKTTTPSPC